MPNEYVAHKGSAFQIEWYYSHQGDSPALEYYIGLDAGDRRKVLQLFKIMGEIGKIHDITNSEMKETRFMLSNLSLHRFLSFFVEREEIIITRFLEETGQASR